MTRWFELTFAALAIRPFRVLWVGTFFAFLAFFMSTVVQSVVAFELSGTNRAVGFVVFGQGIAMVLLGPIGGAFADRWPKRRVVACCQALAAALFVGLGLDVAVGAIRIAHLFAGALLLGASFAFLGPARQALVVELVPAANRGNAMALSQIANSASRVLGPGLAGLLLGIVAFGAAGAYGTMAVFYATSATLLLWIPKSRGRSGDARTHLLGDVWDGIRYVGSQRRLRLLVSMFVLVVMAGFPFTTVLPGLVENQLGREVEAISTLYLASAVGGLAAGLFLARYADSPRAPAIFTGMGLAFGFSLFGLSLVPSYGAAVGAMLLLGAGSGGFHSLSGAVIVRNTDPLFVGRVLSLTLLAFGAFGLMALPVGLLADAVGERGALVACGGGVCLVVSLLGFRLARL